MEEEITLKTKLQNILNEKGKLTPSVLKNGTTILGVTGTYTGEPINYSTALHNLLVATYGTSNVNECAVKRDPNNANQYELFSPLLYGKLPVYDEQGDIIEDLIVVGTYALTGNSWFRFDCTLYNQSAESITNETFILYFYDYDDKQVRRLSAGTQSCAAGGSVNMNTVISINMFTIWSFKLVKQDNV